MAAASTEVATASSLSEATFWRLISEAILSVTTEVSGLFKDEETTLVEQISAANCLHSYPSRGSKDTS